MGSGDYCNPATVVVNTKTFFWDTKEIARNLFEGEQSLALRPENGDLLPSGQYIVSGGRLYGPMFVSRKDDGPRAYLLPT